MIVERFCFTAAVVDPTVMRTFLNSDLYTSQLCLLIKQKLCLTCRYESSVQYSDAVMYGVLLQSVAEQRLNICRSKGTQEAG